MALRAAEKTGHGDLAERALEPFIPNEVDFPYTVRIVSDVLESNGSSSMATVCSGSLALFHAGVPMRKAVAGIAMGLILEENRVAVLSDILGDEDFLGDMDFKVTGTDVGITACQMDIKIEGLSVDIMRTALEQARVGRLHILGIMNETMSKPAEDLSPFAPRLTTITIPQEMIGAVIGPGGEMIRSIVKETGAEINIEDDGTITIAAIEQSSADAAIARIREITRPLEVGTVYSGKVKEIKDGIGAIVEIMPKKQGLLHISQLAHERVENVTDVVNVGDIVDVKLLEITPDGKMRLSRRALIPMPDGSEYVDEGRGGGGRGGDRGGTWWWRPRWIPWVVAIEVATVVDIEVVAIEVATAADILVVAIVVDTEIVRKEIVHVMNVHAKTGPREDRPRDERPRDERPREDRPRDERPREDRPRDERPRDDGYFAG